MRALIGRDGLATGEGLLLCPAPSIHTAFLRFPIDVLFLDSDLRVLRIVEQLRPWRIAAKRRARAVLELAAGEIARRGVKVGDRLSLRDRRPAEGVAQQAPRPARAGRVESSESIIWSPSLMYGIESARVTPMRILVVSGDRHFRSVTAMLLLHHGCSVTSTANMTKLVDLLAHNSVDVVVVDRNSSREGAYEAVRSVRSLAPLVGVVVVGEHPSQEPSEYPVIAKWGPFADLFAAIERTGASGGSSIGNGAGRYSPRDRA
jgi:uncharacterized membrane protein (UPF0127 family)/CheY-like chemotaxis protein